MDQIQISKPDKCHLWASLPSKEILIKSFDDIISYRDDYHNTRSLKKCKTCGQLYFSEYCEEIDFRNGNDQEYYVFIPVDCVETANKLNNLSQIELAGLPGIFMNFPPYNSKPYWNNL